MQTDAPNPDQPETPNREPVFNLAGPAFAMILLCIAVHCVRFFFLNAEQDWQLIARFAFFPVRYSGGYPLDIYAVLSPVTYSFLHGSWMHLAVNMVWLAAFGSPLARRFGWVRFLVFWIVTSMGAVALHFILFSADATPLVGASGAISGMMAAGARYGFKVDRSGEIRAFRGKILTFSQMFQSRLVISFLGVWFVINIITGLATDGGDLIAWQAHIGGFLTGLFVAPWLDPDSSRGPLNRGPLN